ncbi:MarR family winged helix-turn-helix transcriptional regulator [[Acholeplasma] multilocale]|uniref:MarR family winged helix-turn-helix transcriptional regulator n=1 Tax=[Acholeplasma] multilocale TaxID=264638 RepID=UPI000687EE50|nr:MarR family transcriptional regulator [[Acholeplasma] multilocale]
MTEKKQIVLPFTFKVYFLMINGIKYVNKKAGLKRTIDKMHTSVLLLIFFKPGINQNGIAKGLGIDKTTMSRIVIKLAEEGLITKVQDPSNKRSNILKVTDKGNDYSVMLTEYVYEYREKMLEGIPESQWKAARDMVDLALGNVNNLEGDDYFDFI